MDLSGNVAVITGGASGIGLATARRLSAQGCRLVLADIEEAALTRAASELSRITEVLPVVTDVSNKHSVDALATRTDEHFGGADVVFLNAGVGTNAPILETSHADWEWVIGVDLWGPIHGVEAFLPRMVSSGRAGHLLFTASFAGLAPNVGAGPYCVAKYALAEVLHKELRDSGIGVSVVCPMLVDTNVGRSHRNRPTALGGPGPDSLDTLADPNLVGRVLPPDVVAEKIVGAIGTEQLYVVTHDEMRPLVARRFARIDAAFA
jgi:NAD(P)-dependent dehydrogenase (short-subunit alcohol dehydrogenase family)